MILLFFLLSFHDTLCFWDLRVLCLSTDDKVYYRMPCQTVEWIFHSYLCWFHGSLSRWWVILKEQVKVGKWILGSLIKIRELELCSAGRKAFVYSCSKPSRDFLILIMPLKCRQSMYSGLNLDPVWPYLIAVWGLVSAAELKCS